MGRLALLAGFEPRVVLVADPAEVRGDAAAFLRVYQNLGGTVHAVHEECAAAEAVASLADCAVLIDALLGTGVKGEVHGPIRAAIEAWPGVRTIAVDLPSGMNADTGEPCGCCIKADVTVTFQCAKAGFTAPVARGYLGELVVADIGIPAVCIADDI